MSALVLIPKCLILKKTDPDEQFFFFTNLFKPKCIFNYIEERSSQWSSGFNGTL